jgi:hypothetical protein
VCVCVCVRACVCWRRIHIADVYVYCYICVLLYTCAAIYECCYIYILLHMCWLASRNESMQATSVCALTLLVYDAYICVYCCICVRMLVEIVDVGP